MSDDGAPASGMPLAPEEALRAELYGVLAHLFASGPEAQFLRSLAASDAELGDAAAPLGAAWRSLKSAADAADASRVALEHAELFVGTGRAPVSIYASHYLTETWKEHTLVELRDQLQALGLARAGGVSQPEDHMAALLEVMRHLALRGDDNDALAVQAGFFERYLGPWGERFCGAIEGNAAAEFYCAAAKMLQAFFVVEQHGFSLQE